MDKPRTLTGSAAVGRALEGRRILVTRAGTPGTEFVELLASWGASPLHCPAITFAAAQDPAALDAAARDLSRFSWVVFTSGTAIHAFAARLLDIHDRVDIALPDIACLGKSAERVLSGYGWKASHVSVGGTAAALAADLPVSAGDSVLVPQADIASGELATTLRARGANVEAVVAYHTIADPRVACAAEMLQNCEVDAVTFTSPSTISCFLDGARGSGVDAVRFINDHAIVVVCIGNTTAAAARNCGLPVSAIASTPSNAGMVEALVACFASAVQLAPAFA